MNVNGIHHHVSPTSRMDLRQVKVFSMKHLVKILVFFSANGKYCNAITSSRTKIRMQCMCISMCLVLFICTGSMEILISLLLSHQMTVGESNATSSSRRIPCNHTHCVAVFTAPLYVASAEDREMVCFLFLEKNMGPCTIINT